MIKDLKSAKEVWMKLNNVLTKTQKKYGVLVFIMVLLGGIFETLSVSVILPLVQALMEPYKLAENRYISNIAVFFDLNSSMELIYFMCACTIMLYVIKNAYMCLLTFVKAKYSYKVQRELGIKILKNYINRDYTFFLNYTSSECLRDIGTDVGGINTVLSQGFTLMAECITILFIFIFIFITDYRIAIMLTALAIICLAIVLKVFRNLCKVLGEKNRRYGEQVFKYALEAFRGIKEIKILRRQSFFIKNYEESVIKQNKAAVQFSLSLTSPSYVIEALCVTGLLLCLCLGGTGSQSVMKMVPQLAAFTIAAFRILPSLGKISSSINNIIYAIPMVNATYNHMQDISEKCGQVEQRTKQNNSIEKVRLNHEIKIDNISFKYPKVEKNVISQLNLTITKGKSVAFIGSSGAGKTTLTDIILGLLKPQTGKITVDEKDIFSMEEAWSHMIGYVPQSVYLINDTIRRNVAFGIEEIDIDNKKVWKALEEAQLKDFVEGLKNGINTYAGEGGARFSGGQKQRLAIARALYNEPDILVLDEATSALDNETEKAVIGAIENLQGQKTMIVVAHRLTTVLNCDEIYEIIEGKAVLKNKDDIFKEIRK